MDMTGREMIEPVEKIISGYLTDLQLPDLTPGLYFLRVNKNGNGFVKKVLIE
jgi:hypothetical protein